MSQPVTLTCDNYLFAGDRTGKWWMLDVNDQSAYQHILFNGIVNGDYDHIPEQAFYMVGTIDEVVENAKNFQ